MYIGEVIRRVQSYCPSEYDINEMYSWCDEVSSMLLIEDRNVFIKEVLLPDSAGCVILPKGVEFENIVSVTAGGKQLQKEDLRNGSCSVDKRSSVEVTYLLPYTPIRISTYEGTAQINKEEAKIIISENPFKVCDSVLLQIGDTSEEVQVLDIGMTDELHVLYVAPGSLNSFPETGTCKIERIVTDETICPAPYDSMYIDYIIAKICLYQRDFNTYNQFMTLFNSRLIAYKKWITNQLPQASRKLKNWW